ncbi:MAG: M1 family metallopeptidase [Candidatus Pacebacteria bacterium]|nr:M1 family metallopeptidase [Candidatus Paceibacterota bacterium]MBP9851582.1 M1 family metallopeptidase [Candidatus Paceibacterota bacterium]
MKNLFSLAVLLLLTFSAPNISAQKPEPVHAGDCNGIQISKTDMAVSFDWSNEIVNSKATITAYMSDNSPKRVKFSAKGNWNILSVKVNGAVSACDRKDSTELTVFFPASTLPGQVSIEINYRVIKPQKGVYFINPRGEVPGQAKQIWVQGEMEDNSWWMPIREMSSGCLDKVTGSITLDVPSKFTTVSNGIKLPSKKLKGGMRRDTWRLDKPHSPYLWTFIIGEFDVIKDNTGRVPIEYYVQRGYKDYAEQIFPKTRELLDFFSERFGPYPWPAYRQVIVENFQFGAMENTTCVVFNKSFQGTRRELQGNMRNFAVVAHEMMHHWFGDLTTCSGWDDFTLNEGWATYSEWIAIEKFFGKQAAFEWFKVGRGQYFDQCKKDAHPLIDSVRASKNCHDMFDGHSYKKGGWVYRNLNEMVGDSLFYASCRLYLTANAYKYADWHDLQSAFETVCHCDLSWYFDEWGGQVGHPIIDVHTAVMGNYLVLGIEQTQRKRYGWEEFYLESIPTVTKYKSGKVEQGFLHIGNVEFETMTIPLDDGDSLLFFAIDPDRTALVDWHWHMSLPEYQAILWECENFPARSDAFDSLTVHKAELKNWSQICDRATDDMSPSIASRGLANVPIDSLFTEKMAAIYLGDGLDVRIRKAALSKLDGPEWQTTFVALCEDKDLQIQALALQKLLTVDTLKATQIAISKWADILMDKPVVHERFITRALLDVLLNAPEINFKLCVKSVCENGGPYVWGELEGTEEKPGPMTRWLTSLDRMEREDFFLPWLRKFGDRFAVTLKYFGPKVPAASTGSGK